MYLWPITAMAVLWNLAKRWMTGEETDDERSWCVEMWQECISRGQRDLACSSSSSINVHRLRRRSHQVSHLYVKNYWHVVEWMSLSIASPSPAVVPRMFDEECERPVYWDDSWRNVVQPLTNNLMHRCSNAHVIYALQNTQWRWWWWWW